MIHCEPLGVAAIQEDTGGEKAKWQGGQTQPTSKWHGYTGHLTMMLAAVWAAGQQGVTVRSEKEQTCCGSDGVSHLPSTEGMRGQGDIIRAHLLGAVSGCQTGSPAVGHIPCP